MSSKLSENAKKVAENRYFLEGENWETCSYRVADIISNAEGQKKLEYRKKFHEMIYEMDFLPAGRIIRNSGRPRGSLFNCYNIPIQDSIEEIGEYIKNALILWSEGGGIGTNFSSLRPKGDPIRGKGGYSSGLVSYIEAADAVATTIESGGSRRAACLGLVDISHPEVLDFIDAKLRDGKLSNFNISVAIDDLFIEAVETNSDWRFKFKQREYGKESARVIWNKIMENMIKSGEPGLINWTNLIKNNSYYYDPIAGVNPCAEAVLSPYDVCDLGSLVLPNFITGNVNTNWKKLEQNIKLGIRFLDDVIDINKYVLHENDIKAHNSRRVGLGVMGLAEYLFMKQIRYGSDKAIREIEKLMRFIRDCVYQTLIELSVEKGSFPKFDPVLYGKASFIRKLPASIRMDIKKHGSRCVTGMAIAPTGTISLLADTTSSLEPLLAKAYLRHDRVGDRVYIHPIYEKILLNNKELPEWLVDAYDLKPEDHLETQVIVQKYVDGATSKTINLPKEATASQLSHLLLEYVTELKGVTVYRDSCKDGQIINKITAKEALEYLKKRDNISSELIEQDIQCSKGTCSM